MRNYLEDAQFRSLAEDAYHQAVLRKLKNEPFTDPDRMGAYALLYHHGQPAAAVCCHYLQRTKRLLCSEMYSAGRFLSVQQYCMMLESRFHKCQAEAVFLSCSCLSDESADMQNAVDLLSRITLFGDRNSIPVAEAILLCGDEYKPLRRFFEEKSRISRTMSVDL